MGTMHRLVSIINTEDIHADPTCFVEKFSDISRQCVCRGQIEISKIFMNAVIRIRSHLTEVGTFLKSSSIIAEAATDVGGHANENISDSRIYKLRQSVCSGTILSYERSFY